VLVGGLKRMKAMGMKLLIVFDSSERLPIFSATGLDKVFTVYRNLEDAINS
jgi:anti-anti-sigma regulatory factor